ncbi:HEAT repeat domain-containing protein [Paenibacillus hemerocallicola]|uniref:HEAT repeat domain-containing protein n=1 Tax=Paenibacillus hemerocallicola TaxID=1172614 RepID=A0A5C4T2L4_9BACL|nr:HEAT repeat domain-containing protein [Paenibacillus hemerocallicola]TNJ62379.1 HEAT repeat domain-containing protein [Paenibacillus hemerocallicola]
MSIDVLFELQHEVRRLFIAGSGLAAGDMRLQKTVPQLEKLGESSPVFTRLAKSVSQVLTGDSGSSAVALLELGNLLQSVLYTQGTTETKDELRPLDGTDMSLKDPVPFRKLQPLLQALTQKGQGRLEQLQQACEERLFRDFRVLPAAVQALDDSYAEVPEYLHRVVLPDYGLEALDVLRSRFRPEGGKGDARRLDLIHRLLRESSMELLLHASAEGSMEVRTTAIELLGHYLSQESYLLDMADDKKKEIRRAAYTALSRLASGPAIDRLRKALNSKDREIAIEPIQQCDAHELVEFVIQDAEKLLDKIVSKTGGEQIVQQLLASLRSLEGKRVPKVTGLLIKLLSTDGFIVPETEAAQEAAAELLLEQRSPEADLFAVSLHEPYKRKFIAYSFKAALRICPADEIYEKYAPDLKQKKQPYAKPLLRAIHETVPTLAEQLLREPEEDEYPDNWDPRWVRLFAEIDEEELVCGLIREPDRDIESYLVKKCMEKPNFGHYRTINLLLALFRIGYRDAPELMMNVLESGGKRQLYYLDRTQHELLSMLPGAYADRLRTFAETLTYDSVKKQVLDVADSLALKPAETDVPEHDKKGTGIWGWIKNKMR